MADTKNATLEDMKVELCAIILVRGFPTAMMQAMRGHGLNTMDNALCLKVSRRFGEILTHCTNTIEEAEIRGVNVNTIMAEQKATKDNLKN